MIILLFNKKHNANTAVLFTCCEDKLVFRKWKTRPSLNLDSSCCVNSSQLVIRYSESWDQYRYFDLSHLKLVSVEFASIDVYSRSSVTIGDFVLKFLLCLDNILEVILCEGEHSSIKTDDTAEFYIREPWHFLQCKQQLTIILNIERQYCMESTWPRL